MFTGIVEEVGSVKSVEPGRLVIAALTVMDDLSLGDSISVSGACLTVASRDDDSFSVDVVPETLRRTNLGSLAAGDGVNLERSLAMGGRLGGHIVQGHVDATGTIDGIEVEREALLVSVGAPMSVMRYVVEKGFIAVDGTSLTVVNCFDRGFTVTLIPYTRANTVLGARRVGDSVNLEVDILAKYVERLQSGTTEPIEPPLGV
jgi:riboflavin synthase